MRRFTLLFVAAVISAGVGFAAAGLATRTSGGLALDRGDHPLPPGLAHVANTVLALAEQHDLEGLIRLSSLGVANNPSVYEEKELFAIPGEFNALVGLLTTSAPVFSPDFGEYAWSAGESTWLLNPQTRPRTLPPRFGGLQLLFGSGRGGWQLLDANMPPAETFAPFSRFGLFVGEWTAHDRSLTVNPDGSVLLSARGFACPASDLRCQDHFVGDEIVDGENATGRITKVAGRVATLVISFSTLPAAFPLGTAQMTYQAPTDSVDITKVFSVCGPRGTPKTCGA